MYLQIHTGYAVSIRISNTIAMLSYLILWIRLEILNYKFGEGFVVTLKKWWTDRQQGETFENEEFGINFQRITTVFACVMSLTFFYSVSEPFLNYPLFGIEGKVFSVALIQTLFIAITFTVITIQNLDARKLLKNLITGSNEKIQITRM